MEILGAHCNEGRRPSSRDDFSRRRDAVRGVFAGINQASGARGRRGAAATARGRGGGGRGRQPARADGDCDIAGGDASRRRPGNFVSGARRRGTGRATSFHHWSSPRRGEGGRASLPWAERANVFEIDFDSRRRDVARRALLGGL